jgi:tungstate transport system substrate-binding protein
MGDTLLFAEETGAYTLTDRGTFLSMQDSLPGLVVMVGGERIDANADPALLNPYGVIPVNPDKGGINAGLAQDFVDWLTGPEAQALIETFGVDEFGQPLFYPDADPD